ncbi:podocin [Boleophthalmus pectinirostris]|uniref:podocin n=1 Tax=Boleophthalmus pectinirostris TaxID=150288 RepID=UPI00242CA25A|nr:podocin [Boleophthalmus pectinirostris]
MDSTASGPKPRKERSRSDRNGSSRLGESGVKQRSLGALEWLLMVFVLSLVLLFLPVSIWFCIRVRADSALSKEDPSQQYDLSSVFDRQVVREHERAVVFRMGHQLRGKPRGPGECTFQINHVENSEVLILSFLWALLCTSASSHFVSLLPGLLFFLPILDVCHIVDVRLKTLKIPLHTVVTKDLLQWELSAVCYYQLENVALCSGALCSLDSTLQAVVQGVIRDVLSELSLSQALGQRRRLGQRIQRAADALLCRWGIRLERADIEELILPAELQRKIQPETEARPNPRQLRATDTDRDPWDGLRSSLRLLHPALVLPLPPDLLNVTSDLSSLPPPPPPPPPPVATETEKQEIAPPGTEDSPMM